MVKFTHINFHLAGCILKFSQFNCSCPPLNAMWMVGALVHEFYVPMSYELWTQLFAIFYLSSLRPSKVDLLSQYRSGISYDFTSGLETDEQKDTPTYRDARTHLKKIPNSTFVNRIRMVIVLNAKVSCTLNYHASTRLNHSGSFLFVFHH